MQQRARQNQFILLRRFACPEDPKARKYGVGEEPNAAKQPDSGRVASVPSPIRARWMPEIPSLAAQRAVIRRAVNGHSAQRKYRGADAPSAVNQREDRDQQESGHDGGRYDRAISATPRPLRRDKSARININSSSPYT